MLGALVHGPLEGHNDQVYFVAFSPDSKQIISASCYGSVCVWNADTGALISGPSLQHTEGALVVVFTPSSTYSAVSPDGKWIAARDETANTCITFSPDSRRVLTASHNKTILVHALRC